MFRLRAPLILLAFAALCLVPLEAGAQADATTLRIVIPTPPGPLDAFARIIADAVSQDQKRPVIVENRPGAGGNIAAEYVASSPPDGRTVLLSFDTVASVNPFIYKKLRLNPDTALQPLAVLGTYEHMLVVRPSIEAHSLAELVAVSKRKPLNFASSGSGSPSHLAFVALQKQTGLAAVHIPYKGAGPAMNDLLGGHVDATFTISTATIPLTTAGRLRALGYSGKTRTPLAPDVPTFAELGLKDLEISFAYVAFLPAGTPDSIAQPLFEAFSQAMSRGDVRERVRQLDVTPAALTAAGAREWIQKARLHWGPLVKELHLAVD